MRWAGSLIKSRQDIALLWLLAIRPDAVPLGAGKEVDLAHAIRRLELEKFRVKIRVDGPVTHFDAILRCTGHPFRRDQIAHGQGLIISLNPNLEIDIWGTNGQVIDRFSIVSAPRTPSLRSPG